MELALRFDYGRTVPWVTRRRNGTRAEKMCSDRVHAIAGPNQAVLHASVPVHGENLHTVADFTVNAGERAWFTLTHALSYRPDPPTIDVNGTLAETEAYWQITLKAMTFEPTGGVVAAITTSLPEAIGGVRNWDYRYCWLRDTTFTLLVLTNAGYYEEAAAWQNWLLRALAGSPDQVQIMYGIKGERELVEWEANWLAGYENSRPVRIGNAAALQLQLDIYGEMLDCFFHAQHSMNDHRENDFRILALLLKRLEVIWHQPDEGVWETRSGPRQFTYSKMMAWVAFDRAVLLAEQLGYDAPLEQWRTTRDAIHSEICAQAFNEKKNAFTQFYGSDQLDAALLLMPVVGFLPGNDPRVRSTVEAIERELMPDGLVLRYDTSKSSDGLPPGEGAFLACSFWMVSALKAVDRMDDARALFERLLTLRNDLGLLSEEYDVERQRLVGNFPQAFSHIALVSAAFDLQDAAAIRKRADRQARRQNGNGHA
jgi:GH15 family glucan-1,4-alpha-glucosidase